MDPTIDKAFVQQFEAEVHLAFQRQGSRLRPTVRNKTGVKGAITNFQRVGKGQASIKGRHGKVPVMGLEYADPIQCVLQDWYAGEWIDPLGTNSRPTAKSAKSSPTPPPTPSGARAMT